MIKNNGEKTIILILGVNGMVGQTVYTHLKRNPLFQVFGTQREKTKKFFTLTASSCHADLERIYKSLHTIDFVINCIGDIGKNISEESVILVNALFPHMLESISSKHNSRLIHISSDAVFNPQQQNPNERTTPYPQTVYGMSKLLGEIKGIHSLTVRTSFLGFDKKDRSIPSWIDHTTKKEIPGYTNQTWTGCTTIQFAQFCQEIITKNRFESIRTSTPLLHFIPIKPTTKYEIVNTAVILSKKNILVKKAHGDNIIRCLATCYPEHVLLRSYSQTIKHSLQELYAYHKKT